MEDRRTVIRFSAGALFSLLSLHGIGLNKFSSETDFPELPFDAKKLVNCEKSLKKEADF